MRIAQKGNIDDEIKHLRGLWVEWANNIKSSWLTQAEAWYCLNASLHPKMTWHPGALTLSEEEWNYVHRPALEAGLNRSRMCN